MKLLFITFEGIILLGSLVIYTIFVGDIKLFK